MDIQGELDVSGRSHGFPFMHHSSSSSSSASSSSTTTSAASSSSSERGRGDDSGRGGAGMSLEVQLVSALMSVRAKEELVREHVKVSEEAVSGWEKAEQEAASLRDQLEAAARENFSLEDRVLDLDAALRQCRRQFHLAIELQERRFQSILTEKNDQWRSEKFDLENLIIDLAEQLQIAEKIINSPENALRIRLQNLEMENNELRLEILSLEEQIEIRTAERDLNRQHLEKIVNIQAMNSARETKSIASDKFRKIHLLDDCLETEKVMDLQKKMAELEKKINKAETEKSDMEKRLAQTRDYLIVAQRKAEETERRAEDLHKELLMARISADLAKSRTQEMQEKVQRLEKGMRD